MAFKDILVHLDNHRTFDSRVPIAISLAQQSEGRIAALYGFELPEDSQPPLSLADALYVTHNAVQTAYEGRTAYERERDTAFDNAAQCEAAFHAAAQRAGVPASWETWPEEPRDLIALITGRARYADIAILGQADPKHPMFDALAPLAERIMLDCGRPVLIVPYEARIDAVGKRVLVAWNGSREAARAIADALPLLQSAERVKVLAVGAIAGADRDDDQPLGRIVRHLEQHAIRAEGAHLNGREGDAADLILSEADDIGCDLLVMGGYGHSRTRERILGGVTRAVLQHMTVPVLMSH